MVCPVCGKLIEREGVPTVYHGLTVVDDEGAATHRVCIEIRPARLFDDLVDPQAWAKR